jgi:hypothetical protein
MSSSCVLSKICTECNPRGKAVLAVRRRNSSSEFLVYELAEFPTESLFILWRGSVGSPRMKNPPDGNKFWIPYYEESLPPKKFV